MSLGITQLAGFGAGGGPVIAAVTFTDSSVSNAGGTGYTFSSQALGAAQSDRMIVVGVCSNNLPAAVSSVTVGGVSATAVVYVQATDFQAALYRADVPTGTTGDVVVTWSASVAATGIGVFRVTGANTTPTDTASDAFLYPVTGDIDIPANGICIAINHKTRSDMRVSWTNLTERYDEATDSVGTNSAHSGACDDFATAQTGLTITCAVVELDGAKPVLVIGAWGSA